MCGSIDMFDTSGYRFSPWPHGTVSAADRPIHEYQYCLTPEVGANFAPISGRRLRDPTVAAQADACPTSPFRTMTQPYVRVSPVRMIT